MGTNFYWAAKGGRLPDDMYDPAHHIGKRSAAGLYCWHCGVTLCKAGKAGIHWGRWENHDRDWYKACPLCGKEPQDEGMEAGPVALELGMAKPRPARPTGVRGCSSFSWAQDPAKARERCERNKRRRLIVDEYGELCSGREFLDMLEANCPVEYTDSIGVEFS